MKQPEYTAKFQYIEGNINDKNDLIRCDILQAKAVVILCDKFAPSPEI